MQGLGHLEVADVAGHDVTGPLLHEQAAVLQHPDGLDGVERDALGTPPDLDHELLGQARREAIEQLADRLRRERREPQRLP